MDEFYVATLCAVSMLILCVTFYVKQFQNPGGKRPRSPPGPLGLPVVGYLPFLTDSMIHDFERLERKYGRIFKLHIGRMRYTIISSHSLAKEVLSEHDAVFANRVTPISVSVATSGGRDVAWSPLNHNWRTMRRVFAQELVGSRSLDGSYHRRKEEVRKLMKRLRDDMVGKPTPVHEVCFAAVIGALSSMCWGATVAGESGERVAAETMVAVANVMDMLGKPNVSDFFPFISWLDIQGIKRKTEIHTESLNRILDAVIAEYKKKSAGDDEIKKGKGDFVQILHEISEDEDAAGTLRIDQAHLKGMLADTLVAGIDITAATEWAMAELMNNLEVMAKAQKELSDVVGLTHIVEEHHVPRLKYLEAVIKETLRLHPPVPLLLPRSPSIPSTVGGYTIPKDTCVFINAWSIHRDPTIWENPMKFKPERFLEENWNVSGNQCQYLPFGWGRRICAGRAIGEKMVLYVVASLVHSFDWVLPQGDKLDMSETFDIGLRKSTPLVIIPSPRSRHSTF